MAAAMPNTKRSISRLEANLKGGMRALIIYFFGLTRRV
jgi:hypothetical protein